MTHYLAREFIAAAIALGVLGTGATLEAQTAAETLLASTTDLRCTFATSVRTTWKNGVPQPVLRTTGRLVVTIRNINVASGSALLIREPINKDLTVVADEKARYFIDAGGGRVTVTMVFAEFSTGMKFRAAYSVHDYVALDVGSFKADPEVAAFAGDCEIAPPAQ